LDVPVGTLAEAYLRVDPSRPPGEGITDEPMQFHGIADLYEVVDAQVVARLHTGTAEPTNAPAVVVRNVGRQGGQVAAFTYDLARSVVLTRQGNPAIRRRRTSPEEPRRTSDWFRGSTEDAAGRDWLDRTRIGIPQADEQQRLLVNLIHHVNREGIPLPRFWYLPRREKAVVILTGDDHGRGGTATRFAAHRSAGSLTGRSTDRTEDWERIRSTSYVFVGGRLSNSEAAAFEREGFEIGLHLDTSMFGSNHGADWTPASLRMSYGRQLKRWRRRYPSLSPPVSVRTHSVVWTDWATQARVESEHGIRFDTNFYHWPASWIGDLPGFLTGSALPMRFADVDGTVIDVYQAATHLTDESGQAYAHCIDRLLEGALGPDGYYGAFTVNAHTDNPDSDLSDAVIRAAVSRDVPVISARQMLTWLDARNGSHVESLERTRDVVRFDIRAGKAARGLVALVPMSCGMGIVESVSRDGTIIRSTRERVKGLDYAVFDAESGSYEIVYGPDLIVVTGEARSGADTRDLDGAAQLQPPT
jgi:hypothetical protein